MSQQKLIIFDTTMRDGEQSPGASMTKDEKLRIARALERMRVDVIEAGFPAASNGDFEAVQAIARTIRDSRVCGLCRTNDRDIQRGIDALQGAAAPRIHVFLAYFTEAVMRLWAERGAAQFLALGELLLSLAFFAAAVTYARLTGTRAAPR